VKVMGGELIELPSDRFKAAVKVAVEAEVKAAVDEAVKAGKEKAKKAEERGRAIGIIESSYENSLSDADILTKLCRKLNISVKDAQGYLEKYKNSDWES
jgi:predicted TIM-barrel fold metal-dependent hydrolase